MYNPACQKYQEENEMKKIICKVEYNTETAELVKKYTFGNWGDANGYEEILFSTPKGNYFVYGNGGAESKYPEEQITRLAKGKVDAWIAEH